MSKVIIFGNSKFSEVVHFYLKYDSEHEVIGFTVDAAYLDMESFQGLPIFPFEALEKYYSPDKCKLFISIGYKEVNKFRSKKYYNAKERGYQFISYISSKAIYYGTPVGENCFILEDNVIQPFVSIGDNCILANGNHIGHHSVISNHCFITSNVVIGGEASIGEYTFIGLNSTIRDGIKIGKENVIGAGSIILSDTEDQSVYSPGETRKLDIPSNLMHI